MQPGVSGNGHGLGYRVVASTGRPQESDYLKALGASEGRQR
ncbi:hypothetical protein PS862_01529 [Pseudomonas fluorescens]|uniref:Uncharacterized protein n=1 Tax=Pseudomonas fluorescens TaxID=294 RepID=A0A5E7IJP3_PSEFL|nr:hypothetical protein [Pseudomonas fluorescens]VVO74997.1 hypothetical protein PS862_01529 [Pseudomonas fluorescens]